MELVIKITDEDYDTLLNHNDNRISAIQARTNLWKSLKNGIVLPNGHGDLKDASELAKEIKSYISDTSNLHYDVLEEAEACNTAYQNCLDEIEDAPTLIEADKESEGQIVMTFSEMKQAILQAFIDNDDARLQRLKIMDSNMYAEVIKALEMDVVKAEEALNR